MQRVSTGHPQVLTNMQWIQSLEFTTGSTTEMNVHCLPFPCFSQHKPYLMIQTLRNVRFAWGRSHPKPPPSPEETFVASLYTIYRLQQIAKTAPASLGCKHPSLQGSYPSRAVAGQRGAGAKLLAPQQSAPTQVTTPAGFKTPGSSSIPTASCCFEWFIVSIKR